ncbi:piggyBac transposable element-derived protein 4-like [Lingula anatina]|uniref:PiggyBac transposable element-derived protein 4-like n=1 Tax=Lingula anatina TaxID=7574 RepID=A0A2R2MJR9_LINAN|nr:piggyBac transposable element-derived protein 4-like [Lingula anatina]|eukprot:XP_023930459.1 piggyBac transposable element-derived protein 4-like [Lingula anatina]
MEEIRRIFEESSGSEFSGFNSESESDSDDFSDISLNNTTNSESFDEIDNSSEDFRRNQWENDLVGVDKEPFCGEEPGCTHELTGDKDELDFFKLFFSDEILNILVENTNLYAAYKGANDSKWREITLPELKAWLGIRVAMSILYLPRYDQYWSNDYLLGNLFIPTVMTRDRFDKIQQYFHANKTWGRDLPDRGEPGHDRLLHVRPILDILNQKCLQNYNPHQNTSVDEGMIAFRGRLGFRQYLPAKPTKYGIKVWVRADPENGYLNEFQKQDYDVPSECKFIIIIYYFFFLQIYTGRQGNRGQPEIGLGARVVLDLCENISGVNHIVNMDNYFSSPQLFEELLDMNIYARGTVRSNRRGYPSNLLPNNCVKVQGENRMVQKGEMIAVAWKDKKVIHFLSTAEDPASAIGYTNRKQKTGEILRVSCPVTVSEYNAYMNGVDRADQLRNEYCTYRTSKKWWLYVFWFLFDVAKCNAFICMKESQNHILQSKSGRVLPRTLMDFTMNLSKRLIGTYRNGRKRKLTSNVDPQGTSHLPRKTVKAGRCRQCSKNGQRRESRVQCSGCSVSLCIDCFEPYHQHL